jgi:hypothetical protein
VKPNPQRPRPRGPLALCVAVALVAILNLFVSYASASYEKDKFACVKKAHCTSKNCLLGTDKHGHPFVMCCTSGSGHFKACELNSGGSHKCPIIATVQACGTCYHLTATECPNHLHCTIGTKMLSPEVNLCNKPPKSSSFPGGHDGGD